MDVAAGFPGSMHNARVHRNNIIYEKAEHGDIFAAGPIYRVDGSEIQPYLVGAPILFLHGFRNPFLKVPEIRMRSDLTRSYHQRECKSSVHSEF